MIPCQKELFDLPSEITYLNGAYMSPMTKKQAEIGANAVRMKLRPFLTHPSDFFTTASEVKKQFAALINAPYAEYIALIPSVSYGISTVARNIPLQSGDEILVVSEQFPSNFYPWKKEADKHGATLKIIPAPEIGVGRGAKWNELVLAAISTKTKIVALPVVHWADGTRFQLKEIGEKVRKNGGYLVIDGTQSVGALTFDIAHIQPDALVCASYKWLFGPYSSGFAYFSERMHAGTPLEENWINRAESEQFDQLVNYRDSYQPGATRFDMGEKSSFIHLPILKEGLRQLIEWGQPAIQEYCKKWSEPVIEFLRKKGAFIEEETYRGNHLLGIYLPSGINMEHAKEEFQKANIYVSVRGKAIRISPHVYNSEEDQTRILQCFSKIM